MNESTLATISERGQMILPARIRKALGLSANAQVAVRIVKRGDHFIAEIEEASLAALEVAALRRRNVDLEDILEAVAWLQASVYVLESLDDLFGATEKVIMKSGLRAGNAFYVACAQINNKRLVIFDKDQAERAKLVKLDVVLL